MSSNITLSPTFSLEGVSLVMSRNVVLDMAMQVVGSPPESVRLSAIEIELREIECRLSMQGNSSTSRSTASSNDRRNEAFLDLELYDSTNNNA